MKKLFVAATIPFFLSTSAWAAVIEHCPEVAKIRQEFPGVYTAPTVSGRGEWVGSTTTSTPTGNVAVFEEAYFHRKNVGDAVGWLGQCNYRAVSTQGPQVKMFYRAISYTTTGVNPIRIPVKVEREENWRPGFPVRNCVNLVQQDPTECAFSEVVTQAE